jgi:hypothetical protein
MTPETLLFPPYNFSYDIEKSLRLCSLWDMIDTPTSNIVNHASGITQMRDNMKARYHALINVGYGSVDFSESDKEGIRSMDNAMRPWLVSHDLHASIDRLDRVVEYANDPDCHIDDLADLLDTLLEVMEGELRRKLFFSLPSEDMRFYQHPELVFPATLKAFPSAKHDIKEACRCYALEVNTACVFHSMAVAQTGLHALAGELGVAFSYSLDLAEWQAVIEAIENKLEPMRHLPRAERAEILPFYSECAVQFRYFKDAWRNHVCHMREVYDRDQAHSILLHVRDFMEKLSTRIKEK